MTKDEVFWAAVGFVALCFCWEFIRCLVDVIDDYRDDRRWDAYMRRLQRTGKSND